MLKFFGVAGAAFAAAALLAGPAAAGVIYDNLGAVSGGSDSVIAPGPLADSFSTGAGGFALSDVQLLLSNALDGNSFGGPDGYSFMVSLLADNATHPGAVIATTGLVSDSVLTSSPSVVDFKLSASLAANTRYWIELATPNSSSARWSWSFDTSGPGVAGEYSANAYGVYPNDPRDGGPAYQMAVLSGAVPEPATWAMLILGVAMIGFAARRQRQQRLVAA